MAKASLKLSNGTVVTLEGTPQEIKHLLEIYGGEGEPANPPRRGHAGKKSKARVAKAKSSEVKSDGMLDFNEIVTIAKDCDEAEAIETQILDRTSQVDRALLALYIVYEYLDNAYGLTSGDVHKVTTDLGIPISQPNASRTLSGTGSKYVIGDKVKVKGQPVRYKLSRRGLKYMKEVLAKSEDGLIALASPKTSLCSTYLILNERPLSFGTTDKPKNSRSELHPSSRTTSMTKIFPSPMLQG